MLRWLIVDTSTMSDVNSVLADHAPRVGDVVIVSPREGSKAVGAGWEVTRVAWLTDKRHSPGHYANIVDADDHAVAHSVVLFAKPDDTGSSEDR